MFFIFIWDFSKGRRKWILLAISLALSLLGTLYLLYSLDRLAIFVRGTAGGARVPGEAQVSLTKPGVYTILCKSPCTPEQGTLQLSIFESSSGREVAISKPFTVSLYSLGGRKTIVAWEFFAPEPGYYKLRAESVQGTRPGELELSIVGGSIENVMFGTIELMLVLLLLVFFVLIAVSLFLVIRGVQRGGKEGLPPAIEP
jgi:hypothetical protein